MSVVLPEQSVESLEPAHDVEACDLERCLDCQEYWVDVIADRKYDAMRGN